MLKALEIIGFKSFADRTRFEFPPGITVIVGPNGSGKSNIVDAVKWVLGEQSVKSLRGREMTDVIFNGSGSRKPLNSAEITLTLDNTNRLLAIDAAEVQITRRVYRGGESEYLLNRNPARLRDIRDLLSGTGLGNQAYCIIEQGKVEQLLQPSPRDRREIFEEAAGISRFKLRKLEALRRLERVDQNLLRLNDILEEVESRLRSVRAQAGKARRYKEYADRLQELRTQAALVDWKHLGEQLSEKEGALQTLRAQRDSAAAELEKLEAQALDLDNRRTLLEEELRRVENQVAANRERIAAAESALTHERQRREELEQELARYQRQLLNANQRAAVLEQQSQEVAGALHEAEENHRRLSECLAQAAACATELATACHQLCYEREQTESARLQQTRLSAAVENEIGVAENRVAAIRADCRRREEQLAHFVEEAAGLRLQMEQLQVRQAELNQQAERAAAILNETKERLTEARRRQTSEQEKLAELRTRYSAAAERAALLEELIRRHEGLGEGVKEVLRRAADPNDAVFKHVFGLAADVFQVGVEIAPLIEIALGQKAQYVLASPDPSLLNYLQTSAPGLQGRVGFIWFDEPAAAKSSGAAPLPDLHGRPGVIGRADHFIRVEPPFALLAERLLGRTWFVEKLEHALALSGGKNSGLNFVTLAGELLEADGTLTVGPREAAVGLISRRSQLRALSTQLSELEAALADAQQHLAAAGEHVAAETRALESRQAEQQRILSELAENRASLTAAEQQARQLEQQCRTLESELQDARRQEQDAVTRLAQLRTQSAQANQELARLEAELRQFEEQLQNLECQRLAAEKDATETKVELAKSEERLGGLRAHAARLAEDRLENDRTIAEARNHLEEGARRLEACRSDILRLEAEIAELYAAKEKLAAESSALVGRRDELQIEEERLGGEVRKIRDTLRKLEEQSHTAALAANEVRHERNALAARFREDYGLELAELERRFNAVEPQERATVQEEIEELRRKIANLGNVNLEALEELEQLESRYNNLAAQHQDLKSAKQSLENILQRINADSRRMFLETLETVRGHFQTLFRELFGGGQADIVLEENVDVLESGIEIVARPPGKEPRSISLLSGGEKTLTSVALLLAIFRSRPSPFCVLDEVDAALDEANIDRFIEVLKGFLAWTQFIIVTHSKRTMTVANTIYGVTMQESGVSKQVSVRFEDVSDTGEILLPPAAEEESQAA